MTTYRNEICHDLVAGVDLASHTNAYPRPPQTSPKPGQSETICVEGPVVEDTHIHPLPGQSNATKVTGTMSERLGGATCNVARAIQDYGGQARPIFLVGNDRRSDEAMELLGDEFRQARFDRSYKELRRSIILPDGRCFTTRPPLQRDHAPEAARAAISTAAWTVVAPLAAEDFSFT